jgi:hypothetical protein
MATTLICGNGIMRLHKEANRPNGFGGTSYRTLCGRTNRRAADGMNIADSDDEVTCKFCRNQMKAVKP